MGEIRNTHLKAKKRIERNNILEWRQPLHITFLQTKNSMYSEQKSEDTNEQDRFEKAKSFREIK